MTQQKSSNGSSRKERLKPLSLYPLKPEQALWAALNTKPPKLMARQQTTQRQRRKK